MKKTGQGSDPITPAEFTAFYPQFAGFEPFCVMAAYLAQANARFSAFTVEDAEEARRLYVAHRLTLYARTAVPYGTPPSMAQLAAAGQSQQKIAGKKVGEVSVTYAAGASSSSASVRTDLADLAETAFGQQLLSLIRLYGRSVYIP